jgi:thioredoxin-dependent peroxiredoxin
MAGPVAEGGIAPDFNLAADSGNAVSLKDFRGRKLVLYFYPKADTPGCTKEAMEFSRLRPKFEASATSIVGVSADPVEAQAKFKAKYGLAFPLASNPTHEMLGAYGVWAEKSMYGRKYMGIERTTYLIGADGRVARVWSRVKVPGHAEEVLEAAKALEGRPRPSFSQH